MTSRTHDLAAFTALNTTFIYLATIQIDFATLMAVIGANFIGGLAPDLDNSSAHLWKRIRGGSVLSKLIAPLLGGHRLISHSLLGVGIMGFLFARLLDVLSSVVLVDMQQVWWGFMIGLISHLVMDALTKDGIPLLFPLPFRIGIPPLSWLRIRTGGLAEKALVFPGLMLINGYLIWRFYGRYLDLLASFSS